MSTLDFAEVQHVCRCSRLTFAPAHSTVYALCFLPGVLLWNLFLRVSHQDAGGHGVGLRPRKIQWLHRWVDTMVMNHFLLVIGFLWITDWLRYLQANNIVPMADVTKDILRCSLLLWSECSTVCNLQGSVAKRVSVTFWLKMSIAQYLLSKWELVISQYE